MGPNTASMLAATFGLFQMPSRAKAKYAASVTRPGVTSGLQALKAVLVRSNPAGKGVVRLATEEGGCP